MKTYLYRLTIGEKKNSKEYGEVIVNIKNFMGNDKNEMWERFEKWFIKQPYERENIVASYEYVQHTNY